MKIKKLILCFALISVTLLSSTAFADETVTEPAPQQNMAQREMKGGRMRPEFGDEAVTDNMSESKRPERPSPPDMPSGENFNENRMAPPESATGENFEETPLQPSAESEGFSQPGQMRGMGMGRNFENSENQQQKGEEIFGTTTANGILSIIISAAVLIFGFLFVIFFRRKSL